jgi:HAD superfamily hydrolase (TIGR01509 family)
MVFGGKNIQHLIFDFGGVIINIDYALTQKAFMDLGLENFDDLYSKSKQDGLFDILETGHLSPAGFREKIRQLSGRDLSDSSIDNAWNAMLLDIPFERVALLEKLKRQHSIYLLSNTNEIHIEEFLKQIDRQHGLEPFHALFHKIYFSSRVGMRKPNREIFELVLDENELDPAETLFIDDSIQHIEGARKIGLQTLHLDKGQTINGIFSDQIDL